MQVGAAVAEVLAASPYRAALIASSSWSHAFLSPKNGYLWPDHEGDRLLFDAVSRADYATWRKRSLAEMEFSGQHEMLNWMALIGAMEALDRQPGDPGLHGDLYPGVGQMLPVVPGLGLPLTPALSPLAGRGCLAQRGG